MLRLFGGRTVFGHFCSLTLRQLTRARVERPSKGLVTSAPPEAHVLFLFLKRFEKVASWRYCTDCNDTSAALSVHWVRPLTHRRLGRKASSSQEKPTHN